MAERAKVIIDAGHGGAQDPGAVYYGRREKDDTLKLALAVGRILSREGVDVVYTRVDDTYDSPFEKAEIANRSGADYFVSLHRNAMPTPNTASGIESLVYEDTGVPSMMARNINAALQEVGFTSLGVIERPGLVVLRRTQMPAVLVEAGFIDNEADNMFFDRNFQAIAEAIANGVMATIEEEARQPLYYQVQVGAYQNQDLAHRQASRLDIQGFPAFVVYEDGLYKVRVGAFLSLDNAAEMEQKLRNYGYSTFMVRERAK